MKKLVAILMACIMIVGLTACGQPAPAVSSSTPEASKTPEASASSPEVPAAPEATTPEVAFNYTPVENTTGKEIRIAAICVQNNPFWVDVKSGIDTVTKTLADPKYNCTVDFISMDTFDAQKFKEAIDTCIVKGYDAITTVGVSDAIVPSINKAVEAGIPVYTFNSDPDKESKRTAFVGQDLYAAGGVAGETLVKLLGGEGQVGVITGMYSVPAHELRRKGAEEVFNKSAGIKVVGTVENHDSADEAYTATKDFITANPDLKGIYVTAGGPHGAAKALEELGLTDKISLVCFDFTSENIEYVRKGAIKATIDQDPFGQGADPIILAYNEKVTGKAEVTGKAYTKMDAATPENVDTLVPSK